MTDEAVDTETGHDATGQIGEFSGIDEASVLISHLQACPSLACSHLALFKLVTVSPKRYQVRVVYDMNPQALRFSEKDTRRSPLHIACHRGICDRAIRFLIDEYPANISMPDKHGDVPFDLFMGPQSIFSLPSLNYHTLAKLLNVEGQCHQKVVIQSKWPWYFLHGCDLSEEEHKTLLSKVHLKDNRFEAPPTSDTLTHQAAELFCTYLFPRLESCDLTENHWTTEAFRFVLEFLGTSKHTIRNVRLSVPRKDDGITTSLESAEALAIFIERNAIVEDLFLRFGVLSDEFVQALLRGFRKSSTMRIKKLRLHGLEISNPSAAFSSMLTDASVPRSLVLDASFVQPTPFWSPSGKILIAKLKARLSPNDTARWRCFLLRAASGSLEDLEIIYGHGVEPGNGRTKWDAALRDLIVDLIKQGSIRSLRIAHAKCKKVDVGPILEAIKTNASLKTLYWNGILDHAEQLACILRDHNKTLAFIDHSRVAKHSGLYHHLMVNKFGGGIVGEVTTSTPADLVKCLSQLQSAPLRSAKAVKESVAFGLLRLNPSLWAPPSASDCNLDSRGSSGRKRTRLV